VHRGPVSALRPEHYWSATEIYLGFWTSTTRPCLFTSVSGKPLANTHLRFRHGRHRIHWSGEP